MTEIWKDIDGYEGLYQVSNLGRVMALANPQMFHRPKKNKLMVQSLDTDGYLILGLTDKFGHRKTKKVHRLVATAFINNDCNYKEVNHINETKTDNRAENLEWCTTKYNLTYGHRLDSVRGEKSGTSKLTDKDVLEIRHIYQKGSLEYGQSALSKKYGVSHIAIGCVVRGETWKHLPLHP